MPFMNRSDLYLTDAEDGLLMRESGAWVAEKLDYLRRYLDTFTTAMREKPWRGLNFIDLFSGPGKCKIRKTQQILLGSPLLALTLQHSFTRYFFVDKDPAAIAALKTRCDSSDRATRITYFTGDSNQVVTNIVDEIDAMEDRSIEGKWTSLNLAFLDPEGFELTWSTVALLGSMNRMDLIIYYPQMGINRDMPKDFDKSSPSKIDAYFGGMEWRDIYKKNHKKEFLHRELIDLYKERLKSLEYVEVEESGNKPLMRNTRRKAPLYRLIFASKHPLGEKFWSKITKRDVYGQEKLPTF